MKEKEEKKEKENKKKVIFLSDKKTGPESRNPATNTIQVRNGRSSSTLMTSMAYQK